MLKVTNHTNWETRGLRRIMAACIAEVRKTDNPWQMRNIHATVKPASVSVHGSAYYNRNIVNMYIPGSWIAGLPRRFALIFIHELGHCLGKKHRRGLTFENCFKDFLETITDEAYPLKLKEPRPAPPKPDLISLRYARATANLRTAETRLKRARTLHKKWAEKVRYYEKKMAAGSAGLTEDGCE